MTEAAKKKVTLKVKATPKQPVTNAEAAKRLYGKADEKDQTKPATK